MGDNSAERAAFGLEVPGCRCAFWLPVTGLRSKSNFRRRGKSSEWSAQAAFADELAWDMRRLRPVDWVLGDRDRPVAERPSVIAAIDARTTLDCGNVDKTILDAGEGVIYWSDAQVRAELVTTERSQEASGFAAFAVLDVGTDPKQAVMELSLRAAHAWHNHGRN